MLNQLVVVGRIVKTEETKTENGRDMAVVVVAVPRSFKNPDGVYETDFIECSLFGDIANQTKEWCNKGDLIGIKGRIESTTKTDEEGFANGREMVIIAEKVTFLSSKKADE